MKIGYIRAISNGSISNDLISKLEHAGVEKIILGLGTNTKKDYDTLLESIDSMNDNDVLVINTLDDLGDSISDIINILKIINKKDIYLQIIESLFNSEDLSDFRTNKLLRRNMLEILIWVENKEQRDIQRRQREAIQLIKSTKKMQGSGRPKKYSQDAKNPEDREVYFNVINMLNNDIPIKRISEILNISRNTIYVIKEEMKNHTEKE